MHELFYTELKNYVIQRSEDLLRRECPLCGHSMVNIEELECSLDKQTQYRLWFEEYTYDIRFPHKWFCPHCDLFSVSEINFPNTKTYNTWTRNDKKSRTSMAAILFKHFPSLRSVAFQSNTYEYGWLLDFNGEFFYIVGTKGYVLNILGLTKQGTPQITQGYVYILKGGGYYKIGRSTKPKHRVARLATQLPFRVRTIHTIKSSDCIELESRLHNKFADKRTNGEWFELEPKDEEWLKTL